MDKCPFCDYEIEPEDASVKELAEHIVRTHESVSMETFLDFLHFYEYKLYLISALWETMDNLKTERYYNS